MNKILSDAEIGEKDSFRSGTKYKLLETFNISQDQEGMRI